MSNAIKPPLGPGKGSHLSSNDVEKKGKRGVRQRKKLKCRHTDNEGERVFFFFFFSSAGWARLDSV